MPNKPGPDADNGDKSSDIIFGGAGDDFLLGDAGGGECLRGASGQDFFVGGGDSGPVEGGACGDAASQQKCRDRTT